MATLRLAAELVAIDFERITEHLLAHDAERIEERLGSILEALELLKRHPLIGRPAAGGLRELVIGEAARGYVARYAYDMLDDTVEVLALRTQREAGFDER